jgi:hypothetical protein
MRPCGEKWCSEAATRTLLPTKAAAEQYPGVQAVVLEAPRCPAVAADAEARGGPPEIGREQPVTGAIL